LEEAITAFDRLWGIVMRNSLKTFLQLWVQCLLDLDPLLLIIVYCLSCTNYNCRMSTVSSLSNHFIFSLKSQSLDFFLFFEVNTFSLNKSRNTDIMVTIK
jgi:hypothetical protein